jgi:DNA-binding transcriptional ArsR family regulator
MLNASGCPTYEVAAHALAARAGLEGTRLVTRPLGRQFRAQVEALLAEHYQGVVRMTFTDVQLMDASFADEAFAALAVARARRSITLGCLVLQGLDATSFDNLELAVLSRPAREPGLRNCVIPVHGSPGPVQLVGKSEEHVRQTFVLLQEQHQLTARELADRTGLDIGAASTRLKVLYNLGLACRHEARDERGRLYVYMLAE